MLLVYGDDNILFLEEINLRRPFAHAMVPVLLTAQKVLAFRSIPKYVILLPNRELFVKERAENINLFSELWILLTDVVEPQSASDVECLPEEKRKDSHFRPNSMRVSFKY